MLENLVTGAAVILLLAGTNVAAKESLIMKECLSQSFSIGELTEDGTVFDHTEEISKKLTSYHSPYEYNVCIEDSTKGLLSIQMTFADDNGANKIKTSRAGPETIEGTEGITCTTLMFENRGPAKFTSIFKMKSSVSGLGIAYPSLSEDSNDILLKLGKASKESILIELDEDQMIRGFFGASTPTELTKLGIVIENTVCSQNEA